MEKLECKICKSIFKSSKGLANHMRGGTCPSTRATEILERKRIRENNYFKTENGKRLKKKHTRIGYIKNYEDHQARSKFRLAILKGEFQRKTACEINGCLNNKIEAHHYLGYEGEHWKDVKWLCYIHHKEAHGRYIQKDQYVYRAKNTI